MHKKSLMKGELTMGKMSVKDNKTIYQIVREELSLSREKAGELLEGISPERLERIENEKSQPHPDEVKLMAEKYGRPELQNHYCANQCPLGEDRVPEIKMRELSNIVLEMLSSLNAMENEKDRFIDIAADGHVSGDEIKDFVKIEKELERISAAVGAMQLWADKMVANGAINRDEYERCRKELDK